MRRGRAFTRFRAAQERRAFPRAARVPVAQHLKNNEEHRLSRKREFHPLALFVVAPALLEACDFGKHYRLATGSWQAWGLAAPYV